MGEEPLAAARLAVDDQRAELQRTADAFRESLDIGARFRENPLPFIAVGAAAVFIVAGGPGKVGGLIRRTLFPTNAEKAYDSLPKPMQDWTDHMTRAVGPRAGEARESLARELAAWRSDPRKHGKVSKQLAKQIADGPPGPKRAAWNTVEAAGSIIAVALARKAVERLLAGEPEAKPAPKAAPKAPASADVDGPASAPREYAGISSRGR